ncbi:MAG: hypothetical protein QOJ73_5168, partial [Streptosporangiaceae bacterium]|nr:hypothetical protein [Streptosporangiaceae bacterium]
ELVITRAFTGQYISYGTLAPWWEDGMLHGQTIVWIPGLGHLVDPTVERYPEIAACRGGPSQNNPPPLATAGSCCPTRTANRS